MKLTSKTNASLVWEAMTVMYDRKWSSTMGERDSAGHWTALVDGYSREQLLRGFNGCREHFRSWPPTILEFEDLCLGRASKVDAVAAVERCIAAVRDDDRDRLDASDAAILATVAYWDQRMLTEADLRRRLSSAARAAGSPPDPDGRALPAPEGDPAMAALWGATRH